MTDTTTIRPLCAADAEAYRALRLAALAETPQAFGASHDEEAAQPLAWFAEGLTPSPTQQRFGGFAGDRLVGSAGFQIYSTTTKSRHKGKLIGVQVVPDWRGRGLAARLVEAVIAHARKHVLVLQAGVGTGNLPARRLYARLGFIEYGIETKALLVDGRFVDEALLALDFSVVVDP
jgi:RimJ/RimL family protein N-acetyltransferase